MSTTTRTVGALPVEGQLHRNIDWRGAFWVASGVPALVLFSIGGIAGTTGNAGLPDLDGLHDHGLPAILHLCRDRRPVPQQIGRRLGLRRHRLAALFQVHRAAVGVVQLVRLVAGAVARLLDRRRLYAQRAGAGAAVHRGLAGSRRLPRRQCRDDCRRRDRRRHRGRDAGDPQLDALQPYAGAGQLLAQRHLLDRRGADAARPSRSSIAASSARPTSRNISACW